MSDNVVWHQTSIDREARCRLNGHGSLVIWLTGLSGAGKSTIAAALEKDLHQEGVRTYLLDGDNLRYGLNRDLGFSPPDREENIRRCAEVARLLVDAGNVVLCALISPYARDRDLARSMFAPGDFCEVYVRCSLTTCEQRDSKGLYKRARSGEIAEFTGISAPYQEPQCADIIIDTDVLGIEEAAAAIFEIILPRIMKS